MFRRFVALPLLGKHEIARIFCYRVVVLAERANVSCVAPPSRRLNAAPAGMFAIALPVWQAGDSRRPGGATLGTVPLAVSSATSQA
ncbi:MAG TPA: hypothetical protein VFU32_07045 [Ktedonobacterales bacterium]|nr:hypothetical protein [Ktedonobacterales bacterium]